MKTVFLFYLSFMLLPFNALCSNLEERYEEQNITPHLASLPVDCLENIMAYLPLTHIVIYMRIDHNFNELTKNYLEEVLAIDNKHIEYFKKSFIETEPREYMWRCKNDKYDENVKELEKEHENILRLREDNKSKSKALCCLLNYTPNLVSLSIPESRSTRKREEDSLYVRVKYKDPIDIFNIMDLTLIFIKLTKLENLDLSYHRIGNGNLEDFSSLINLKRLNLKGIGLNNSKIETLLPTFMNIRSLNELDLSENYASSETISVLSSIFENKLRDNLGAGVYLQLPTETYEDDDENRDLHDNYDDENYEEEQENENEEYLENYYYNECDKY